MQMYANLSILAALGFYCFSDTGSAKFSKGLKVLSIACVAVFLVTESLALLHFS
jgi:hypothetical protein